MLRRPQLALFILKLFIVTTVLLLGVVWLEERINFSVVSVNHVVETSSESEIAETSPENEKDSSDYTPQLNVHHSYPGVFNLIEDAARFTGALERPIKQCSFELMNSERLQQDHPCVINNIRKHFLKPPAPLNEPLHLDYPEEKDPSDGQTEAILQILKNKTNGFFIECGALDGENLSNTLYLERYLNWTGILIEADQETFKHLTSRKRKSWTLPVCLSDDPYPQEVTFRAIYAHGQIVNDKVPMKNLSGMTGGHGRETKVQCFPLYSILLAVNRTDIDYFSLDVEEHDLLVLKTIPFTKVNITVLSVELIKFSKEGPAKRKEAVKYMKSQGYDAVYSTVLWDDVIFVKREYAKQLRLNSNVV